MPEPDDPLSAWRKSERFKEVARAALKAINDGPKCGAKKRNGQPCRKPGRGAGGRCRLHGGATPKGKAKWHKPIVPPEASTKRRDQLKRAKLAKRAEERVARVEQMTPEALRKYERWQLTHDPDTRLGMRERNKDMETKTGTREELLEEIRTNGAWVAYRTSLEIAQDPAASRRERVQAASNILRAGGLFNPATAGEGARKDPSDMSFDELQESIERLQLSEAELKQRPKAGVFD